MKQITYIFIAVIVALAAASCNRSEADFGLKDSSLLSLSLNPGEMATRASAIPDVEGVVSQFDWFFYADATGKSEPIHHGHFTVSGTTLTPSGTAPSAYKVDTEDGTIRLGFDIENDNNYKDLKGSYYVYVLANYAGIDHSTPANLTLEKLLAKTMETNFDEKNEDYEDIADFVMDSYSGDDDATFPQLIPLTAAVKGKYFTDKDGEGILDVNLRRVAAKITFTLNISEKLPDPSGNGTFWRPLTRSGNFTAYFVNAVSYAEVKGEPQDAEEMAPELITGDTGIIGGYQISYATSHVKTATDVEEGDEESIPLVWELDPFYTYPVEFDTDSNNAPYLKIALPWENVDSEGNLVGQGATLYYYKVYLLDPETKKPLTTYERNKHYIVAVNVSVLGGTPEDYTTLDTWYYVADWQAPAGGTYDGYFAPRYLDIARPEYYLYGDNSTTIAVTSSHVIDAEILSVSQKTIAGGNKMTTVPATAKVTPDGRIAFTLEYPLNTSVGGGNMDLTPITWTVRVSHADDATVYKDVIIYQYPSIYGELNRTAGTNTGFLNAAAFTTSQSENSPVWSNGNNNTRKSLGSFNGGSPTSMDKMVLTVSSLASLQGVTAFTKNGTAVSFSDVVIGDPRVKISTLYNISYQGYEWDRDDLGIASENYIDNYLIGDPDNSNVISPRFMFPSGRMGSNRTNSQTRDGIWRTAAMRCAAYQEDGYPAGRWRLPTEAEVAFCRELQRYGYIDGLFYDTNRYWTSSGTYYYNGSIGTSETTASVRCVYDLWYWGDEPYNNDKVQIKEGVTPNTPATQWLGFMTE